MEPVVAAFDVDGTLTVRDCVFPFMVRTGGLRRAAKSVIANPFAVARLAARRDRDALKAHFVAHMLGGLDSDRVATAGERFARSVVTSWMREDVVRKMRWHQDQGHVVVLVSASLAPYLEPLGDLLEVDAVICTELETMDGVLNGRIVGSNCRGAEKVRRLEEWAEAAGITGSGWLHFAYGDSAGDTEMISAARQGMSVRRAEIPA